MYLCTCMYIHISISSNYRFDLSDHYIYTLYPHLSPCNIAYNQNQHSRCQMPIHLASAPFGIIPLNLFFILHFSSSFNLPNFLAT